MLIDQETIQKAKELLGDRNAELIQELLHMDKYDERRHVACCPNPAHNDHNPSCSYNPRAHMFHCFSCGFNVDVIQAHMMTNGSSFSEACEYLFQEAGVKYDFSERGVKSYGSKHRYPKVTYAEDKKVVYEYWGARGISPQTIDYLNIQQDPKGNTMFQYFDLNDVLVDVKYRLSREPKKSGLEKEQKCWHPRNMDPVNILYNINRINPNEPLIITSGEGDCATCIECGFYNTVSINGGDLNTRWISECWDWLQQFNEIVLVHDNDISGRKFAKDVSTRLGEYRVKIANIVDAHISEYGEVIDINDLNDLLKYEGKEAVQDAIRNAKETEIPTIVDYTDVERFDMSEVPGFITGFSEMDEALSRFYMGTTTILTGISGSGKSSFLSTLICQSVYQGFPVFVYSGELSNPSLKNWVDCVHAGQRGIAQHRYANGGTYYKIKPEVYAEINKFYKGKIFFYKDGFEQKVSRIMSTAESVVRKGAVKTLVFDNLTSMDLENSDENKYQKQEEFIREIINFSKRWNVCCIIVLHPKKMDMVRKMGLFDLQGVSAAVNLAHRVLALYRVQPKEKAGIKRNDGKGWIQEPCPYDVTIEVLKDRFGSGANKTTHLYYDQPSRRFFDNAASLDFRYGWDRIPRDEPVPFGIPQIEEADSYYDPVYGPKQGVQHGK